jgi:hypothetical protein
MTHTLRNHITGRRLLLLAAVLAALALTVGLTLGAAPAKAAPTAKAAPAASGYSCSDKTLDGEYAGNINGQTSSGPFALNVEFTSAGNGTGTASVVEMTETTGPTSFTDTITYTLNADCSGTLTAARSTGVTVHYDIDVTLVGTGFDLMQTDSGVVSTGSLHHV